MWWSAKRKKSENFIDREDPENTDYSKLHKSANYFGFDYALELPVGIQNAPYIFYENSQWMKIKDDSILTGIESEQHKNPDKKTGIGDSNWDPTQVGPMLASKAVAYIKQHTANKPDQSFFMFYSAQAVHQPYTPPISLDGVSIANSTPSAHGDMVHELDTQAGMIIDVLKETNAYENTLIIFTSDNGGHGPEVTALSDFGHNSSNGLRGSKGMIYEGGDRVPFIAVWPNMITPSSQSDEPIVGHDIVATIQAITNQQPSSETAMDSLNLLPLFFRELTDKGHQVILQQSTQGPFYAIRKDQWKLILLAPDKDKKRVKDAVPVALFDLENNPFENEDNNLIDSEEYQNLVHELFDEYLKIRENDLATVVN